MDHREDRRNQFFEEMENHGIDRSYFSRISGVPHAVGNMGASFGWLNAFYACTRLNRRVCCVFEDDFIFIEPYKNNSKSTSTLFNFLLFSFPFEFDVVYLAGAFKHPLQAHTHAETGEKNVYRAKGVFGAAGLCASTSYVKKSIIATAEEGIRLQEAHYKAHGELKPDYTNDFYLRKLQAVDNWFAVKAGMQRPSYSDIEKKEVVYEW